jgi:hypothetical protein
MAFFPSDPEVRAGLITIFLNMIETEEQMEWLANRALGIYARWPGVAEIRALYCARFKPKDGMEGYSEAYPDGYPSERPADLPSPLPPTSQGTADPEFVAEVQRTAALKRMPGTAASRPRRVK